MPTRYMATLEGNEHELEIAELTTRSYKIKLADAEHELFSFIEGYYNQIRLHSHNDYRPPNEVEANLRNGALAA